MTAPVSMFDPFYGKGSDGKIHRRDFPNSLNAICDFADWLSDNTGTGDICLECQRIMDNKFSSVQFIECYFED